MRRRAMGEKGIWVKTDRVRELEDVKTLLFRLEGYRIDHEESCCFEKSDKTKCDCGLSATLRDIYSLGIQESMTDEVKGTYLAVSIALTDENKSLRDQLKFAQDELADAKLVIAAAERVQIAVGTGEVTCNVVNGRWWGAKDALFKALKVYGSKYPGEEQGDGKAR
jgi:hypothetical protein